MNFRQFIRNIQFNPISYFITEASIASIEKNNEHKLTELLGQTEHTSWTDYIASSFDPTYPKQNKYTLWIINGLLRKQFSIHDLDNAKSVLEHFDKNSKLYPKQLTQYKTIQEIKNDSVNAVKKTDISPFIKKYKDAGNILIYSDDNGNVAFSSPNYKANHAFKSVTDWCTTRDAETFEDYLEDGLYVIHINNNLYQFNISEEKVAEFRDAADVEVTPVTRLKLYNNAPSLFNAIRKNLDLGIREDTHRNL